MRQEKGQGETARVAEEGEGGQPGGQAVHATAQSSLFPPDVIGETLRDAGDQNKRHQHDVHIYLFIYYGEGAPPRPSI